MHKQALPKGFDELSRSAQGTAPSVLFASPRRGQWDEATPRERADAVEDLPDQMIFESLDPILHFPGRVAISMLVEPIPPAEAMRALRQERSSRYAGFITRSRQGRLSDPGAMADLQSVKRDT